MSDLLSAASLLLAVLGVLYGLWYPEIMDALDTEVPPFVEDRRHPYRQVVSVLYGRALPLMIAGIGISAIFLPDALHIALSSLRAYKMEGIAYLKDYSAVHTAFVFVVTMSVAITVHMTMFTVKLTRLCRRLLPRARKVSNDKMSNGNRTG